MGINFKDTLFDILSEQKISKAVSNALLTKWGAQNPNITHEEVEKLFNRFREIQNGLSPNKAQVISFLNRFDGQHGYERFDPINLKDILKYSYKEIKFLIGEYTTDNVEPNEMDNVFNDKDPKSTPEKVEASKALWDSENFLIVNEEGLKVFNIPDQMTSINFGYYAESINRLQYEVTGEHTNSIWCVTWRNGRNTSNMWGSYRTQGRSFYFVMDTSRNPETDKYFMGALQVDQNVGTGYRLTSVRNDGDNAMTWKNIVKIYPRLEQYKDLIVNKPYSADELKEKNVVGQISEVAGPYQFKRVERPLKLAYINNHGVLKDPESWRSMDEQLRALYITTTREPEISNKFSNLGFVAEIKKVGSEFTLLNNRLKQLGKPGIGYLIDYFMAKEFKVSRISEDNENIRLYISIQTGKYGLYNTRINNWVDLNGISYFPSYNKLKEEDIIRISREESYGVEIFSKSNQPDDTSFYCLSPLRNRNSPNGRFISAHQWELLREKLPSRNEMIKNKPQVPSNKQDNPVLPTKQLEPLDPNDMDIK